MNDLNKKQLDGTIQAMNTAFPDSTVENFEELIPSLSLPDEDDRLNTFRFSGISANLFFSLLRP